MRKTLSVLLYTNFKAADSSGPGFKVISMFTEAVCSLLGNSLALIQVTNDIMRYFDGGIIYFDVVFVAIAHIN